MRRLSRSSRRSPRSIVWKRSSSERSVYRASRVLPRYLSRLPSSAWVAAQRLRLRRPLPEAGRRAAASYWALSGTAAPPECGAPPRANCCKAQAAGRGGKLRRHPGHSLSPQRRHVLARFVLGERSQRGARTAPYVALLPPLRLDVPVQAALACLLDAEAQLERCRRRQAEEQQQRRREAEPHRGLFAAQPRGAEARVSQRVGGERLALQMVEQQEDRVDASTEQRAEDLKRAEERERLKPSHGRSEQAEQADERPDEGERRLVGHDNRALPNCGYVLGFDEDVDSKNHGEHNLHGAQRQQTQA